MPSVEAPARLAGPRHADNGRLYQLTEIVNPKKVGVASCYDKQKVGIILVSCFFPAEKSALLGSSRMREVTRPLATCSLFARVH